ncbi:hypothetical protein CBP51_10860 [Cellvibrio mixtus]|uniref:Uncharacterized protein n=1 Tax=Cellvibrio mixtus TaxID=39650 RepID=A0A266QC48_9GAMM|nr:hypothetical protein [Cellvibrio mixtus]OZY87447.1 hypothetical protein CBP51_10860 [Cellvibrio mixtus]
MAVGARREVEQLVIDELQLELPASLGARKQAIVRLLRRELLRPGLLELLSARSIGSMRSMEPVEQLAQLSVPVLTLNCQQTNLAIARQLARSLAMAVSASLNSEALNPMRGGSRP